MSFKSDQRDVLDLHLSLPQELLAGGQEHFRVLALNFDLKWEVLISKCTQIEVDLKKIMVNSSPLKNTWHPIKSEKHKEEEVWLSYR